MNKATYSWNYFHSQKFVIAFFATLIFGFVLFTNNFVNAGFIFYMIITVVLFFYGTKRLPNYFFNKSSKSYIKTIFLLTFILRLFFLVPLYYYFYNYNSEVISYPYNSMLFSPNAGDSTGYHYIPMLMAQDYLLGKLNVSDYIKLCGGIADFGYMFYIFIWYAIFGPNLWLHGLSNLLVGSWSVVLVYKIAKNQYNHQIGIISSVMMMLMPFFYYYSAEALKEMVLICLFLLCIYYLQMFIAAKASWLKNLIFGLICLSGIAAFRTFLSGIIGVSFLIALIIRFRKISNERILYIFVAFISLYVIASITNVGSEFSNSIKSSEGLFDKNIARYSINSIGTQLASIPSYLLFVIIGPFPSFVNISGQESILLSAGGSFVRNFLVFFYAIGIYRIIKLDIRHNLFLLMILVSYLFVLAYSGYASNTRYHLPMIPLLIIFSAVGMCNVTSFQKKWFNPFLFLIVICFLGWNFIKLAGRGII